MSSYETRDEYQGYVLSSFEYAGSYIGAVLWGGEVRTVKFAQSRRALLEKLRESVDKGLFR